MVKATANLLVHTSKLRNSAEIGGRCASALLATASQL